MFDREFICDRIYLPLSPLFLVISLSMMYFYEMIRYYG